MLESKQKSTLNKRKEHSTTKIPEPQKATGLFEKYKRRRLDGILWKKLCRENNRLKSCANNLSLEKSTCVCLFRRSQNTPKKL